MYVELKSGHGDRGPARIGRVTFSKSGQGIYYRGRLYQRLHGTGVAGGNYYESESGDEYWISGPKKDGSDRHWAGGGTVHIDDDVADEYWKSIRASTPPKHRLIDRSFSVNSVSSVVNLTRCK